MQNTFLKRLLSLTVVDQVKSNRRNQAVGSSRPRPDCLETRTSLHFMSVSWTSCDDSNHLPPPPPAAVGLTTSTTLKSSAQDVVLSAAGARLPRTTTRDHLHETVPAAIDSVSHLSPHAASSREDHRYGYAVSSVAIPFCGSRCVDQACFEECSGERAGEEYIAAVEDTVRGDEPCGCKDGVSVITCFCEEFATGVDGWWESSILWCGLFDAGQDACDGRVSGCVRAASVGGDIVLCRGQRECES